MKILSIGISFLLALSTFGLPLAGASSLAEIQSKFDKWHIEGNREVAIELAKDYISLNAKDPKGLLMLAEFYAVMSPTHQNEHDKYLLRYERAKKLTKAVIRLEPNNDHAHYIYAVALGQAALLNGILNSLFSIGEMEEYLLKAVTLNPSNYDAHYMLSRVYRQAPGFISIGNINKAKMHIDKTLEYFPAPKIRFQLEAAEVYFALEEYAIALTHIKTIEKISQQDDFEPTNEENRQRAAELKREIKEQDFDNLF